MSNSVEEVQAPPAESIAYVDRELWQQFAAAQTPADFCGSWLGIQCSMLQDARRALVMTVAADGESLELTASWPINAADDWQAPAEAAQQALKVGQGVVVQVSEAATIDSSPSHIVAFPILVDEQPFAAVVVEVACADDARLEEVMRQLQWGASWLELLNRRAGAPGEVRTDKLTAVLGLVAASLEQERYRSAANAFVTELATRLQCERATIGFAKKGHSEVIALSHTAQFDKRMNLVTAIGRAMDEAIDQRAMILYPGDSQASHLVDRHHAELAADHGDAVVHTFPISRGGEVYAALTVEYAEGQLPSADAVSVCETAATLVGPLLESKRQIDRPLPLKIKDSINKQTDRLFGPLHFKFKIGATLATLALLFLVLAEGDHRITAKAVLEGEVQRAVVAPFDGYIADSGARAGDTVTSGQELGGLDDKDLLLEQRKLTSQRAQLLGEYREAFAGHERARIRISKARIDQIEAQLALINEKLRRTRLLAPIDGVIVTGDLSQSLGAAIGRGQVLFEIAPLQDYRVILQVDERDIAEVMVDQRATLVLSSLPNRRFELVVSKITPVAEADEGTNYFRVESRLEEGSTRLRPGMKGVSKIIVGRRKLIWIWTHRMIDWLRLWLWSWAP